MWLQNAAGPWVPGCDLQRMRYPQEGPLTDVWHSPHHIQLLKLQVFSCFPRALQKASFLLTLVLSRTGSISLSGLTSQRCAVPLLYAYIIYHVHIRCLILDAASQVNKMPEQRSLEPFVGRVPLPPLPSYLQPGNEQAPSRGFLAKSL